MFFNKPKPVEMKEIQDKGVFHNAEVREKVQETTLPNAQQIVDSVSTQCVKVDNENIVCNTAIKFKKTK